MRLLALAVPFAALTLAGCSRNATVPTPRAERPPRSVPAPVAVALPSPDTVHDGGMDFDVEPVPGPDVVGLAHDHRSRVDHLARSAELRGVGDLEGALTECRRAAFDAPGDEDALRQTATLARLTGKLDLAIESLSRLGRVRSEDPLPLIQEARLLVAKHDDEGALEVAQEALLRDDQSAEAYHLQGQVYLHRRQIKDAIQAFLTAVDLDPNHGYAMNNLGFAYLLANENDKAVDMLARASELLPQVAYVANNLGVALERVGKVDEAKLAYARATSLSPKYVKAQLNARRLRNVASASDPLPEMDE